MWKWPVVKYKHIKIHVKPRICVLYVLFLTWTVNANSSKQNIIVIKEIVFCCHLGWMNKRWFCLQKTGSQEHIYLISIMFRLKKICIHRLNVCPRKRRNISRKLWLFGIGLNYPWHDCLQLFLNICMFILSRTARWCQYLTNSAFLSFFWGCQKSALIAILKTPCASIFF